MRGEERGGGADLVVGGRARMTDAAVSCWFRVALSLRKRTPKVEFFNSLRPYAVCRNARGAKLWAGFSLLPCKESALRFSLTRL